MKEVEMERDSSLKRSVIGSLDVFPIGLDQYLFLLLFLGLFMSCNSSRKTGSNTVTILETILVDSVVADFPVSFSFLSSDDRQFIAYYNKNRALTIASRKTSNREWDYHIFSTKVGWDSHNSITMAFDRENCIHVSGNVHNDSLIYFKTEKPFDIQSFERIFPMVALEDELKCTYPNFIKRPNGSLVYSYRKGGSGKGITIMNIYEESTKSFKRLVDQPLFDGLDQMSAYASGPSMGPDGFYHLTWLWRDTPHSETNHDLSYARSEDLVHWETLDGTKIALPITPGDNEFTVDPVPAKGGAINGGMDLFFDQDNNPLIVYMKYDNEGNSELFLAKGLNDRWTNTQISHWGYRWDFSGPGSLEFEIKINNGEFTPDGKIRIEYWHIQKGNGELILDGKTLSLIEDRPAHKKQEYPAALLAPVSKGEGKLVKWLKVHSVENDPYNFYAFRWETMGKRRFYEQPDQAVPPSALMLYRLSGSPE